eukprot:scaffold90121_cov30-Tisochrysis_lutea.AAC.7
MSSSSQGRPEAVCAARQVATHRPAEAQIDDQDGAWHIAGSLEESATLSARRTTGSHTTLVGDP